MGKVKALHLDTITEASGHRMTGVAASVCTTPAAPSPVPLPYPTAGSVGEGIIDPCLRTRIEGAKILTVGGCMKSCHGNEPGSLREVVSLNTGGPCFPWLGAPNVLIEQGMAGITGSLGQMNKSVTAGAAGTASSTGAAGAGTGKAGGGAAGPGAGGPGGPSNGGGNGGGAAQGAGPPDPPVPPGAEGQAKAGHPIDVVTGAMYTLPVADIDLRGPLPLQWIRQYRTSAVRRRAGLGWGWIHSFAWRAEIDATGIVVIDSEGSPLRFPRLGDEEIAHAPFGRSLERRGDELVLATRDRVERILRPTKRGSYRLTEVRDRSGNATRLTWDGAELVGLTDCVGRRVEREHFGKVIVLRVITLDEGGEEHRRLAAAYELDRRGDLVRVVDAGGVETSYRYDEEHFLVEERLPDGLVYHFRYQDGPDGKRRCVETWGELPGRDLVAELAGGLSRDPGAKGILHMRLRYGPGPYETTITDACGGIHRYRGNALGLVEEYTDPLGRRTRLAYDPQGHLTRIQDPMGHIEHARFDRMGRLLTTTDPLGRATRIRRDDEGNAVELGDAGGGRWTMQHDRRGRLIRRADPSGNVTTCSYDERGLAVETAGPGGVERTAHDAHGNLVEQVDVRGARRVMAWDLLGLPVRIVTPTGAAYELSYDSRGDLVLVHGPHGRRMERAFDARRRVVAERHPGGGVTRSRYLGEALVERAAPDGGVTRWRYDAMLRVIGIENAAGERHVFEYDAAGQIVREVTFAEVEYRYEYDLAGRCISKSWPDGRTLRLTLDAGGTVLRREHGDGTYARLDYDERGSVKRATNGDVEVVLERDPAGRVVREIQRVKGFEFHVIREHHALGYEVGAHYSTGWSVSRKRGPAGVLLGVSIRGSDGETQEGVEILHGEEEILRRRGRGDGLAVLRDQLGRPTRIRVHDQRGNVIRERRYEWAHQPGLARIEDSARGIRIYELDPLGRPLRAGGLGVEERYEYTPQGTPLPRRDEPSLVGRGGRKLATGDAGFVWDVRGRLVERISAERRGTWSYRYDDENRLVEARRGDGFSVRYVYDPFGRRVAAHRSDGTSTFFGWDRDAMVEEVHTGGGGGARYVYRDDGYTPLLTRGAEGGWQIVASDAVGTPWLYLDAAAKSTGLDLDPLGRDARVEGRPPPLRFAGQRADAETGLRYHRHRYYSPELGTFLTPDPLGLEGSLVDVGFVPNATEYLDPLGLVIILGFEGEDDKQETRTAAAARAARTGQRILRASELRGPHNPNGVTLEGEAHVEIIGHGVPQGGDMTFRNGTKNWMYGRQVGQALKDAGLEPTAEVVAVVCNAGMTPAKRPRQSVIAGINQATGNPTAGPSGVAHVRPHNPATGAGGGVDLTDGHWEQATGAAEGIPSVRRVETPSTQHAESWDDP